MARTQILEPGTSATPSIDFVVAQGESIKVGVYSSAPASLRVKFRVYELTLGEPNLIGLLGNDARSIGIAVPGTYRVYRPLIVNEPFGAYTDDGK